MMKINLADAKKQGYEPDSTVCASDVPHGRPYPFMCLQNAINLQVSPVEACVKIDDTRPGVEEGLNAAMWTIGLAISGNEIGLSLADWEKLPKADQAAPAPGRSHPHVPEPAPTTSSTASPTSCPASTTSKRASRAARRA